MGNVDCTMLCIVEKEAVIAWHNFVLRQFSLHIGKSTKMFSKFIGFNVCAHKGNKHKQKQTRKKKQQHRNTYAKRNPLNPFLTNEQE